MSRTTYYQCHRLLFYPETYFVDRSAVMIVNDDDSKCKENQIDLETYFFDRSAAMISRS